MTSTRWCLPFWYLLPAGPTPFLKPNEAPLLAVHFGPSSVSMTNGMRSFMSLGAIDVNRSGGIQGMSRWQSAEIRLYFMAQVPLVAIVRACRRAGQGSGFDSQREEQGAGWPAGRAS